MWRILLTGFILSITPLLILYSLIRVETASPIFEGIPDYVAFTSMRIYFVCVATLASVSCICGIIGSYLLYSDFHNMIQDTERTDMCSSSRICLFLMGLINVVSAVIYFFILITFMYQIQANIMLELIIVGHFIVIFGISDIFLPLLVRRPTRYLSIN